MPCGDAEDSIVDASSAKITCRALKGSVLDGVLLGELGELGAGALDTLAAQIVVVIPGAFVASGVAVTAANEGAPLADHRCPARHA